MEELRQREEQQRLMAEFRDAQAAYAAEQAAGEQDKAAPDGDEKVEGVEAAGEASKAHPPGKGSKASVAAQPKVRRRTSRQRSTRRSRCGTNSRSASARCRG